MTTIYLIRHAEAEGNLYRRMHGQLDSMITPTGMRQIAALSRRFADIPVDACYASDLLRTRTTAQAVCVPKKLPLQLEPGFRELQVGIWEDLPFGWLNVFEPEKMACFGEDPVHWQVDGSERFSVYTGRFIAAMDRIAAEQDGKTIAIFSHAAVMRGVVMTLFPGVAIIPSDNTCVTKLVYHNGKYTMEYQNDNGHLTQEISTAARNRSMGEGVSRTENLFWYREDKRLSFTVMTGRQEAGELLLEDKDGETGVISHMELKPRWRGRGRSVQLLGQAVFTFRKMGKKWLELQLPEDGCLNSLSKLMAMEPDENGFVRMSLIPVLHPFVCTAGDPAVV